MNNRNVIEDFCKRLNGDLGRLDSELKNVWIEIESVASTDDLAKKLSTSNSILKSIDMILSTWKSLRPQIEEKMRQLENNPTTNQ